MYDYPLIKIRYNRRNTATKNKTASVEIEITYNSQRKWFSTGVRVFKHQWSESGHRVINHYDLVLLNKKIYELHSKITSLVSDLAEKHEAFTFEAIENELERGAGRASFVAYAEKRIKERGDLRDSTRRTQMKLITALNEFKKISSFSTLTKNNILEFDEWLHARGVTQSTVHSYHKFLKTYIHDAITRGMLDADPYVGVKISRGKSQIREHLTSAEIKSLSNCEALPESLHKVRDMFLFQCFTGLAYSDLMSTDFTRAKENSRLVGRRVKTGETYYIPLMPEAVEILKRYDYQFPRMSNQQYNLRIKAVCEIAGIKKKISSHVGRHTAACLMLNHGVPMEAVKEVLGHADIKTTQIYAKLVNTSVDKYLSAYEKELGTALSQSAESSAKG